MSGLGTLQYLILISLALLAFGLEVFALVDALRTRQDAFVAAGKQTKKLWLIILGLATAFGFLALPPFGMPVYQILPLAGVVAAAVYLADVRPAVRQIRGGGGGRNAGPYGPW
jgi:hypothetical protein